MAVLRAAPRGRQRRDRRAGFEGVGAEPDPRFTFANERTFLAWNRTALALIAGGLVVTDLLTLGSAGARLAIALGLFVMGGGIAVHSYRRWIANERALRLREPLPPSRLPAAFVGGTLLVVAVAAVLVVDAVR